MMWGNKLDKEEVFLQKRWEQINYFTNILSICKNTQLSNRKGMYSRHDTRSYK